MRVLLPPDVNRLAAKEKMSDQQLCEAVARAEKGLVDANLAGPMIKQRIARPGQGRSRGFRTIMVHRAGKLAVFAHIFPKSAKANLSDVEEDFYGKFGKMVVALPERQLDALVADQGWRELDCEQYQAEVSE